ncbi:hypothetical protein KEM60_00047 [Austwickia sp. TVS 96-490-7B]|uniref:trypsin-like peptidase domain-containing protein n=1 Tax=Austwickia sp. TVS 96-490-7B TaxID=2830843 RepID=UPI001C57CC73|nr:trypsin-like peptidase domain-containing protein [Austwickia sp. TVS 96-490-7B]MBW3083869.1 hypothetical protein [Austwickia sp. TVS 96-490-7B]
MKKITRPFLALTMACGIGLAGMPAADAAPTFKDFDATINMGNCSGSIVRFPGASDQDRALVLSNGHCRKAGMPEPGTFILDEPVTQTVSILAGDTGERVARMDLDRIVYATMTGNDVSLYRSTKTYAQLKRSGINARPISTAHPADGTAIKIPSGYWRKNYTCKINGFVPTLREAGYEWTDAVRYSSSGCDTKPGTSGSPVVDARTGTVIAINNTMNEDGEQCTMNNPCEVDENGEITVRHRQGYGTQTYTVTTCFDRGRFDLNMEGCQLFGAGEGVRRS